MVEKNKDIKNKLKENSKKENFNLLMEYLKQGIFNNKIFMYRNI